jgi:N-acetylmuramoyl-L-alanine amidase
MKKQLSLSISLLTLFLLLISPSWTMTHAAELTTAHSEANILKGKVIALDPGHGGSDTGAIGPNHVEEKDVTLVISSNLRTLLSNAGATVVMTRTSDKDVAYPGASSTAELRARVAIANKANADLFISIHANAFSPEVHGTTTYFCPGGDSFLAHCVQDSMIDQLKLFNRGVQANDYYVLKYTTMPAILTEAAFLSNPKEEQLLSNRSFDQKVALGIYNGIKNYFSNDRRA